jgi:hypothetical protein
LSSDEAARILGHVHDGAGTEMMRRRERGVSRACGIALALLFVTTATASWAHEAPHPPAPVADPVPVSVSGGAPDLLLLAAFAAASALAVSRARRLALGLAVLLLVMGVEAGLHAVHHLSDPARAAECAVAIATAHLTGSPVNGGPADLVALRPLYPVRPGLPAPITTLRPPGPHAGRAPPAPIS